LIRSILGFPYAVLLTLYYARRALRVRRSDPKATCKCDEIARTWCRKLLRIAGATVEVTGTDTFDSARPHIIVSNHQSWFDVFAIAGFLPASLRFVAKAELTKVPAFGPAWVACGHISIDRKNRTSAIQSMDEAGRRVKEENLNIVLFPEGTRSADGRLKPFKKGAFVLAIQAGVPIVPVAVVGSRHVMPKGEWRLRPGRIEIRLGQPISVDGMGHDDRDTLREVAWEAVRQLKGEELASENAA